MKKKDDLSWTFLWKKRDDFSWTFLWKKKMIYPELLYEKKRWFVLKFLIEKKPNEVFLLNEIGNRLVWSRVEAVLLKRDGCPEQFTTFRQCGWTLSKDDQVIVRESYRSVFLDIIRLNQQSEGTFLFFSVHSLVKLRSAVRWVMFRSRSRFQTFFFIVSTAARSILS